MDRTRWSAAVATMLVVLASGCAAEKQHAAADSAMSMARNTTYELNGTSAERDGARPKPTRTCPMHPGVRESSPGTCPVCEMELVRAGSPASTQGSTSSSSHSNSSRSSGSSCH